MVNKSTRSLISSIAVNMNKKDKENIEREVEGIKEEKTVNRSYNLRMSTVKKLQRLKVLVFQDSDLTYNEIVDKAICDLYKRLYSEKVHQGKKFDEVAAEVNDEIKEEFNRQ